VAPPRTCLASLVIACGRWRVHVSPAAGQATAEYTVVLALVAAALAGAGAAAGVGGVGEAIAAVVRTGICIAGGDVCRDSDARAAGLTPCTLGDRERGGGGAVTVLSLRIGRGESSTVATRSDGSVVVTRLRDGDIGIAGGFGAAAGPLRLELGVDGRYSLVFTEGRAWEFPDAAAAGRFLAGDPDATPPTWRFGDVGNEVVAEAGSRVGGLVLTGVEASAEAALGARTGRGRTTVYARVRLEAPGPSVWMGGQRGGGREVIVELTRERGSLRELAFRTVEPGAGDGEIVETVGRLDLRVPANREAAGRLLGRRLPWPPAVMDDLRSLVRRTVQSGLVERAVYALDDDSGGLGLRARMGLELGVDFERLDVDRRLVSASAWTHGSPERERVDCVTNVAARRTL
jgi:hypothetical protein